MRVRMLHVAVAAALVAYASAHCPGMCNGHGDCVGINRCSCYAQWMGGDCSLKRCAFGTAWTDVATAVDTAHASTECSNRGTCDHTTGRCKCMEGYTGLACQRMECPKNNGVECSGNGICRNMQYHATQFDIGELTDPRTDTVPTYINNWDAQLIHGCECDTGFKGYDCSERVCVDGDDPMTTSQVNEVQLITCKEAASATTFSLTFRGYTTEQISFDATAGSVKSALEALPSIRLVDVGYTTDTTFCNNGATENVVSVTFLTEFGSLPRLVAKLSDGSNVGSNWYLAYKGDTLPYGGLTQASVTGTKEAKDCSGRGKCNTGTGLCECYKGYISSNGWGQEGNHGDCGFPEDAITSCPGTNLECSGHGVCSDSPKYECTCNEGWMGGDCSEQTCPFGKAWFDTPLSTDRAHQLTECSSKGVCDRVTGKCACQNLFEGEACDRMVCPGKDSIGNECSGHGRCLSMGHLALFNDVNGDLTPMTYGTNPNHAQTWDYDMAYGCFCDDGYEGYDCSEGTCPTGDDITTCYQVDEVQLIQCTGTGSFTINFRRQTTAAIADTATASEVKAALEALSSITEVTVTFTTGITTICHATGNNVASITFTVEHANLPDMTFPTQTGVTVTGYFDGTAAPADGNGDVKTAVTGTKENNECNDRGLCNHATGECVCFSNFGSSDGKGGEGTKADCGYRTPFVKYTKAATIGNPVTNVWWNQA